MNYLYETFNEYIEKGLSYLEKKDYKNAEDSLVKATKYALLSSEDLPTKLKKSRINLANQLLNRIEKIQLQKNEIDTTENLAYEDLSVQDQNIGKYVLKNKSNVTFDDVIGLDEAKQIIYKKAIYPLKYPDASEAFKKKLGGGILFFGPPGTGKTMLAKAIANELNIPFLTAKGSDLMSKFVGNAEKNIRQLFSSAREYPLSILFFDEIDAIAPKRGGSSTVMNRVVPELLNNIQGIDNSDSVIILIGATNTPWLLDDAILRPGRFDEKVYIGPPQKEDRLEILNFFIRDIPGYENIELEEISNLTENFSGADLKFLCDKATDYPYFRWISDGVPQLLKQEDFNSALKKVNSSISSTLLKKYIKYIEN